MIAAAPTPASTTGNVPLPLSGREFEIYRRTAVEGRTTREVAAEFEVSQTRVVQLRNRVFEWIGTHLPPLARLSPAERLRVAETLACEQLQCQYDEAMEAWRKSQSAVHVTRYIGRAIEDGVTVVKQSQGEPKYLRLATQISKAIAKQGMATMPDPETAVPIEELVEAGEIQEAPTSATNHPEGDCSSSGVAEEPLAESTADVVAATNDKRLASEVLQERTSSLLSPADDELGTVQAVLQRLDNVPRKTRKMKRREQRLMQDLIGKRVQSGDLLAALTRSDSA